MTNSIFGASGTTVFTTMSALAHRYDAINLGQGFPDVDGPLDMRQVAADALLAGPNQYPPMAGIPELRTAISHHAQRFYGLQYNPESDVLVTSGATEALTDAILGLTNPGDEVILIEPFFDQYLPMVLRAGCTPVIVSLTPPEWTLDTEELAAAFSSKTSLIIINDPHNPTGTVMDDHTAHALLRLCQTHNVPILCDEVYEHLTFDHHTHQPLATRLGGPSGAGRDLCVRIGSAGKTFSFTGWKIGYMTGPEHLISAIAQAHQFVTFTSAPHLQKAVAFGLQKDRSYFEGLAREMQSKRDTLVLGLKSAGFVISPCQGTYFVTVQIDKVREKIPIPDASDMAFCQWLTEHVGVAAVPMSAFYADEASAPQNYIRFCFCKQDAVLTEAIRRLNANL